MPNAELARKAQKASVGRNIFNFSREFHFVRGLEKGGADNKGIAASFPAQGCRMGIDTPIHFEPEL